MLLQILYPYMKFALGTLYPAYKTWKALKRKDEGIRRRWMKYWVIYSAFQAFEFVADFTIIFILPFYLELKLALIVWQVTGTKLIFDSIVNRELAKREKTIDKWLNKGKKLQEEIIALIWFEISRCSIKIITSIMSGGLSVLTEPPKAIEPNYSASPTNSDNVDEIDGDDDYNDDCMESLDGPSTDETVVYEEPDFNKNVVSMDWSQTNSYGCSFTNKKDDFKPSAMTITVRKSARQEQMQLIRNRNINGKSKAREDELPQNFIT